MSIVCFPGNPADWFLGSCVFGGLRQCEPVWYRAGYPGCKPDIWHSAEPDSGAGYSRLVSGSMFEIFYKLKLYAAKIFFWYLNCNCKTIKAISYSPSNSFEQIEILQRNEF